MLFPKWKLYLYDLADRIKWLKVYSSSESFYGSVVASKDVLVIVWGLAKYGKGGMVRRNLKVIWMWEFAKTILSKRWRNIATLREVQVAVKIYNKLKHLRLETIMSEIKAIKKFAEEVGLSEKKIKGMDENELIRAIVNAVDPEKTYSRPFVAWYDELPEEVFEEEEEPKKNEKKVEKETKVMDISVKKRQKLLDNISEADDIDELKEILEDNEDLFPAKFAKKKDFDELKEMMVEHLEEKPEKEEEPEEKPKLKLKNKKKEEPEEEVDNSKMIKKVKKCEEVEELKELVSENKDVFEGIQTRGIQKFENLQKKMLIALGVEFEEEEEEKPKKERKTVSTESDDMEDIEKLPIPFLKKKAKEMGIKTLPGMNKEKILALIEKKLKNKNEDEEEEKPKKSKKEKQKEKEEEVEIDQSFINKLVKNKDIDALIDAAKELGIKVSILEKKSAKKLGEKIIEFLSEEPEEKPKKKGESIYKAIEKLVLDEMSEKKIIKAVTPLFEEKGEDDEDYIAKKVKQMVAIIKFDNDIED